MKIPRRKALAGVLAAMPGGLLGQANLTGRVPGVRVSRGEDRFGEHRIIGVSAADFKVSGTDTQGGLFLMEHKHTRKGGPALHLHLNEDEWFYVLEGEYLVRVAGDLWSVTGGDSVIVPRKTPHTFAFKGEGTGKLLVAFTPAGRMEENFRAFKDRNGTYSRWDNPEEQQRARTFGMELLGPPLSL